MMARPRSATWLSRVTPAWPISIPASVTSIGAWAFGGCSNLITVTNRSITPQDISNNNAFSAVDLSTVTLRVPSSAVEAYKNAEGWKNFGTIEAM